MPPAEKPADVADAITLPTDDRGYYEHWKKWGPKLEAIRRQELREHGPKPFDPEIIDSLLQLGYLHGNRNPPTGLIAWQKRLAEAYAKKAAREAKQ